MGAAIAKLVGRRWRQAALGAVLLGGIGACAHVAVVVPVAEAWLERRTGHAVAIGSLRPSWSGIVAHDVLVFGKAPFEREVLARLDRVTVRLGRAGSPLSFGAVEVDGAELEVLATPTADNVRGPGRARRGAAVAGPAHGAAELAVTVRGARVRALLRTTAGRRVALRGADGALERHADGRWSLRFGRTTAEVEGIATAAVTSLELVGAASGVTVQATAGTLAVPGGAPVVAGLRIDGTLDRDGLALTASSGSQVDKRVEGSLRADGDAVRVTLAANDLPLRGLATIFDARGIAVDEAIARRLDARVTWPEGGGPAAVSFEADLARLGVRHPGVDRSPWRDLAFTAAFDGRVMTDASGARVEADRASLRALGAALDLTGWLELGGRARGSVRAQTPRGGLACASLLAAQPAPVRRALWGIELAGTLDVALGLDFDSSAWEGLALDVDVRRLCDVRQESADLAALLPVLRDARAKLPATDGARSQAGAARALSGALALSAAHPSFVPLARMPKHLVSAYLTSEDGSFFQHRGFHLEMIRRALAHDLEVGAFARGASTITQQLAKNLFLTQDRTVARKLAETALTWRLDRLLTKDRVLELYLNVIELGPGIRGVGQAARAYFGKDVSALTPLEAAHLASLTPNPVGYARRFREGRVDDGWLHHLYDLLGMMRRSGRLSPAELATARNVRLALRRI